MTASPGRCAALLLALALLTLLIWPPLNIVVAAFMALVPFVMLLRLAASGNAPLRDAALYGALAGTVSSAVELRWVPAALEHYTWLALPGYAAALMLLAALWGGVGIIVVYLWRRQPAVPGWLIFAAAWTTLEWTRGHLGSLAFPWLGLGTALGETPVLIQAAEVVGARGLTFFLAAANVLIAEIILDSRHRFKRAAALFAGVVILVGYGLVRIGRLPMATAAEIGVVATEIPFSPTQEVIEEARDSTLVWTAELAGQGVAVIVGPEAPAPGVHDTATDSGRVRIARESSVPILAGALQPVPGEPGTVFNAMRWFAPLPEEDTVYRKRRLVPLVEGSGTRKGSTAPLLATRSGLLGVLICFESVFEGLSRDYRLAGADILINATNDAWGEGTAGPAQHALHLALRAVETRTPVIRVANRGVSFAVDPLGRVSQFHERASDYVIRVPLSDTVPPYVRWGDWVGLGSVVFTAGALLVSGRGGSKIRPSHCTRCNPSRASV